MSNIKIDNLKIESVNVDNIINDSTIVDNHVHNEGNSYNSVIPRATLSREEAESVIHNLDDIKKQVENISQKEKTSASLGIKKIEDELGTPNPRIGIIRSEIDGIRRTVTFDGVVRAATALGDFIVKLVQ